MGERESIEFKRSKRRKKEESNQRRKKEEKTRRRLTTIHKTTFYFTATPSLSYITLCILINTKTAFFL